MRLEPNIDCWNPITDMITSIHENWFSARSMDTSSSVGEGAIVMQTTAFILVAL